MACGQGSTIKGIPDNVREHITIVGSRADVKFDTLSRKKIPQELYDNEGKKIGVEPFTVWEYLVPFTVWEYLVPPVTADNGVF